MNGEIPVKAANAERAAALEARIRARIPLARAMQVRVVDFDGARLVVAAPLDANINDKGTGFAGSLATLATLSGWSLATLLGESGGDICDAAVVRTEIDFLKPVRGELVAEAWIEDDTAVARMRERLAAGKRAQLAIRARIGAADDPALVFGGRYAVWRQGTQPF